MRTNTVKVYAAKFKENLGGVRSFLVTMLWVLREGLRGRLVEFLTIFFANLLGIVTVAMSFAILIAYAQYQVSGTTVSYKGYSVAVPAGLEGLLLFAGLAFCFGLLSAMCLYGSQKGIFSLAAKYHKDAMVRAVNAVNLIMCRPDKETKVTYLTPQHDHRHVATVYTNYLAISFKLIMDVVQPTLIFLVSLALLVYLYLTATLLLLPLALIYFLFVYSISKKSTLIQGDYMTEFSRLNKTFSGTYDLLMGSDNPNYNESVIGRIVDESNVDEVLRLFYERMLVAQRSSYVSQIFITVSMVWLFVIFGWEIEGNKESWTSILVFLIALRYSGQSLRKAVTIAVTMSRFYPTVRVYAEFVHSTEALGPGVASDEDDRRFAVTHDSENFLSGSEDYADLLPGRPLYFLLLTGVKNTSVSGEMKKFLIQTMSNGEAGVSGHIQFHGTMDFVPSLTLSENSIGVAPSKTSRRQLEELLDEFSDVLDIAQIKQHLDATLNEDTTKAIERESLFLMLSAYLLLGRREIVVLDYPLMTTLDKVFVERYLALLSDSKIIFSASSLSAYHKIRLFDESDRFIIASAQDIIGIGNYQFAQKHSSTLTAITTKLREEQARATALLGDDDSMML